MFGFGLLLIDLSFDGWLLLWSLCTGLLLFGFVALKFVDACYISVVL